MATIELSPLITSISGRIGNIVFYMRRGIQCVREYRKPENPRTPAQQKGRGMFSLAVKSWQQLPTEERRTFNKRALRMNMSGYNLFISEHLKAGAASRSDKNHYQLQTRNRTSLAKQSRFCSVSPPYQSLFCPISNGIPKTYTLRSIYSPP